MHVKRVAAQKVLAPILLEQVAGLPSLGNQAEMDY